jgi:hypothetical protein
MSKAVKNYKNRILVLSVVSCVIWYLLFTLLVNSDDMSKYHFITYHEYSKMF